MTNTNTTKKTSKMYRISQSTRDNLAAAVGRLQDAIDVALDQGGLTPEQLGSLRKDLNLGNRLLTAARGVATDGFTMRRIKTFIDANAPKAVA